MKKYFIILFLFITVRLSAQETTPSSTEFKPSGKLWGQVFGDYYVKAHADSANRGSMQYSNMAANRNGFDLRRIYLGYDYNFTEKFSSELIVANEGQTLADGTLAIYLQAANVKWKNIFPKNDLIVGLQSTPTFSLISDKVWGYRSIEKTITASRGVAKNVDGGIGLQGRIDSAGNFGYNLMIGNGLGSKLESDQFKRFYGDIYLKFLKKKIILDLYGDHERVQLTPYHKSRITMKILLAYQTEKFTVGFEAYQQSQENFAVYSEPTPYLKKDTVSMMVFGASVFARGTIAKGKLACFARYDRYNPDTKFNADNSYSAYTAYNTETFVTIGLDYMPAKNIHIMPNIWYNGYQNRKKNISGLAKEDYDLVPRMTFSYTFK